MARVDENGYWHPTDDDPWDVYAQVHITYCPVCNRFYLPPPKA